MSDRVSVEEMLGSLTGHEEIAIAKHFGAEVLTLAEVKPTMFSRALVFVLFVREGRTAPDAKQAVLNMSLSDVQARFEADEDEDVMQDDPESESGKDESSPRPKPKISQLSA